VINPKSTFNLSLEFLRLEKTQAHYEWLVPGDLPYFDGHFPDNAVLPAIAIVDFSLELITFAFKKPVEMVRIRSARFTEIITPGSKIDILLTNEKDIYKLIWKKNLNDGISEIAQLMLELR
jgi:3-hydroxymyristoyl/3-hydroxydecanoyl-(acyl carrier protein) dehydratase